jgi:ribosome-binding ATPase YchF (GTP1/OBG family)
MRRLNEGQAGAFARLYPDEKARCATLFLITAKPVMYVANVNEDGFENNPHLEAVKARAAAEGAEVVPVCAAIEAEIGSCPTPIATSSWDLGMDEPGLNRVIRAPTSCWACRPTSPPA